MPARSRLLTAALLSGLFASLAPLGATAAAAPPRLLLLPERVWDGDADGRYGIGYIKRQTSCLGGGSTEMARNIISERLLGMPREYAADRDVAFREVRRNAMPSEKGSK